jgi:hypothetical protein
VAYTIIRDGDAREIQAWNLFMKSEFPSYEGFWLKHVVPLTNRPADIHLKDDAALTTGGYCHEDIAIAQLHYTVVKHLLSAFNMRQASMVDESVLLFGLSCLCGAQDVAFEILARWTNRGTYDAWTEKRTKGGPASGQEAQAAWKRFDNYPLQDIRDYRNKLIHGRTPPARLDRSGIRLPSIPKVDQYADWRLITNPAQAASIPNSDFQYCSVLLGDAWNATINYLETNWRKYLLP